MKIRSLLTLLTMVTLVAACAPKINSSPDPTLAPVMTEVMESMEPTSVPTEAATASSAPTEVTGVTSDPLPSGNVFEMEISGFQFDESTITIKIGDTIKWTNHDSATHTVTADDGSFKSDNLSNDASFSYTFSSAGTFPYHCGFHSSMTATVIVEP